MVKLFQQLVCVLWEALIVGLGLLSVYLLVLFLGGFFYDWAKEIIERIKNK